MGLFDIFKKKTQKEDSGTFLEEIQLTNNQIAYLIDHIARMEAGYSYCVYNDFEDPLFEHSAIFIVNEQRASEKLLQQQFKINYSRAGRILDQLEDALIVSSPNTLSERSVNVCDNQEILMRLNTRKLLNKEYLDKFKRENYEAIMLKIQYYKDLSIRELEEYRIKMQIEEKNIVKQEILEKRRKKEIKKQALQELREEGMIDNICRREPIPQEVQDIVWNRDGGKCVKCGSRENLEFDHIIPFSKGGSNSARNLQLLCQKCNREKSNKIG